MILVRTVTTQPTESISMELDLHEKCYDMVEKMNITFISRVDRKNP